VNWQKENEKVFNKTKANLNSDKRSVTTIKNELSKPAQVYAADHPAPQKSTSTTATTSTSTTVTPKETVD
jgi:hypothetical protein